MKLVFIIGSLHMAGHENLKKNDSLNLPYVKPKISFHKQLSFVFKRSYHPTG